MKRKKDEFTFLAKYCLDNIDLMPSKFLKKALQVDLLRNNFAKQVLYNYFLYAKRAVKTGYKCKSMPQILFDIIQTLDKKDKLEEAIEEMSRQTLEDIMSQVDKEFNDINEKCTKIIQENTNKIIELQQINTEVESYLATKIEEIKQKRSSLIREYLEKGE